MQCEWSQVEKQVMLICRDGVCGRAHAHAHAQAKGQTFHTQALQWMQIQTCASEKFTMVTCVDLQGSKDSLST